MFCRLAFAVALSLSPLALHAAAAEEVKAGPLVIQDAWSRATPAGAKVGAGYFTVVNTGSQPDRLVSVTAGVSDNVQVHEMATENGVMKMRHVMGGVEIAPGKTVAFKPGSYHLMFMDLKQPLKKGEQVPATLVFEKAGKVDVTFAVQDIGATAPASAHGHEHMSQ